jgi:hypothetical protein
LESLQITCFGRLMYAVFWCQYKLHACWDSCILRDITYLANIMCSACWHQHKLLGQELSLHGSVPLNFMSTNRGCGKVKPLNLNGAVSHLSCHCMSFDYRAGVHKFSKNVGATSKFCMPKKWQEASSVLRIHKY